MYDSPGNGRYAAPWPPPAPPAPQPGVIPLRPLGTGEILGGAFTTMRRHWRTVFGVSAAVAVVTTGVSTAAQGIWFRKATEAGRAGDPQEALREVLDAVKDRVPELALTSLIGLVGSIVATAMLTVVVSRAILGRPTSAGDAWRSARPELLRLTGLFCVVPLLILLPCAVGVAPGLLLAAGGETPIGVSLTLLGGMLGLAGSAWVWTRFNLAAPALMLEKQGVASAMRRAVKLVRGDGWRIFGIQVLAALIVALVGMIIQIPVTVIQFIANGGHMTDAYASSWPFLITSGVVGAIGATVSLPISAGVTALLYTDQRIRRESLDIELAQAAAANTA
ncbi:hypothetical protein [Streptomyces sp. NPDC049555]|uniref:hypothetical protein n=1 Tax=Streptomyces sp. NPDC049555 TaxID=3154930 RepID=UPI0034210F14